MKKRNKSSPVPCWHCSLVPMLLYVFFQKFGGIWNFLIGKPLGNFSLYYPSSPPLYLSLYYHEVEIPMNEETAAEAEEIIGDFLI